MAVAIVFAFDRGGERASAATLSAPSDVSGDAERYVMLASPLTSTPVATMERFTAATARGLQRAALSALAAEVPPPVDCDAACIRQATAAAGARFAVRLSVATNARDYDVVLELFEGRTGALIARTGERCEVCGSLEVEELIESHAASLRQRMQVQRPPPPRLIVETSPPNAAVWIDGAGVGRAPTRTVVEPGEHRVRAESPRHDPATMRVVSVTGVDEVIRLVLQPRSRRVRPIARAGWALLGVGVSAMIAGIVMVSIDGRENRLVCRGDDVDAQGHCRYVHRTKGAGIGALVGGLSLVGSGIVLVSIPPTRASKRRTAHREPH